MQKNAALRRACRPPSACANVGSREPARCSPVIGAGPARPGLPLLRAVRGRPVRASTTQTPTPAVLEGRRRRLRAHPAVLPARPALQRDRGRRPHRRTRSWPASSSAGCPCLLWIGLGVVFIGAVHDFSSLVASVRHGGPVDRRDHPARTSAAAAWLAMMAFIWVALVYVILAFADITASTFVGRTEDLEGSTFAFNQGGAVALASCLYLLLSIVMGLVDRCLQAAPLAHHDRVRAGHARRRLAGHAVLDAARAAGPHLGRPDPGLLLRWRRWCRCGRCCSRAATWAGSCCTWRSRWAWSGIFLGGFAVAAAGVQDLARAGRHGRAVPVPVRDDRLRRLLGLPRARVLGHDLQADRARVALPPVGYGGMLLEAFVALIALSTVMIATQRRAGRARRPGAIYGVGLGRFLAVHHRRRTGWCSPPRSGRWRSRRSCSTRWTSRRGWAATSCRS